MTDAKMELLCLSMLYVFQLNLLCPIARFRPSISKSKMVHKQEYDLSGAI